jgi:chromate reductase
MGTLKQVLALSGSVLPDANNNRLLQYLSKQYAEEVQITTFTSLDKLPHFIPGTSTADLPPLVVDLLKGIEAADGVLICSPEYVFSVPAVLKNALEWTVASVVFSEKPTAFITASASGKVAYESLLLILKTLGATLTPSDTLLIQGIKGKVDAVTGMPSEEIKNDLKDLMHSFLKGLP